LKKKKSWIEKINKRFIDSEGKLVYLSQPSDIRKAMDKDPKIREEVIKRLQKRRKESERIEARKRYLTRTLEERRKAGQKITEKTKEYLRSKRARELEDQRRIERQRPEPRARVREGGASGK
jgi:hypothetical protein